MFKIGQLVTRMLAGCIPMELEITEIDEDFVHCGDWKFDKNTGIEIDEELEWDNSKSGSYLVMDKS